MLRSKYQANIQVSRWVCILLTGFYCSSLLTSLCALNALAAQPDSELNKIGPVKQIIAPLVNQISADPAFSPKVIESLLKEQFKVVKKDSDSSFPFPTLVPRSSAKGELDSIDGKYEVLTVQTFDDKDFFQHQKILLISVSGIFLEARIKVS